MSFSQILGQERAKKFLARVMARDKIPHAYLFTGIPGIGKATTAMALSMALNCLEPIDGDGCGHCVSCRQMKSGNFPDFQSIRPQGQNVKIDQIRDLNRTLSFAPVSGRYRVTVIHRAETMTAEAANSFLKILEEPPPGNILILNATEPLDLLSTIVSRCQRVPFQPLSADDMTYWLVKEKDLDEETAAVLASSSGGSLGRALKMSRGDFVQKRQEWLQRLIGLSGLSMEKAMDMALDCVREDKKQGLDASETWEANLMDMLAIWETWYRDLLLVRVGGLKRLIINADFFHKLQNTAEKFKIEDLKKSIFAIDQSQWDLRRMRNTKLVMEHTVLSLKSFAGYRN
ncbi:MAG: DNA polymerase III subunit delta' [Desulfobacteraceae bacterium]|nr:MAG: DNA polymerase III subunit delta' [Desulfobacteraceae bacterium]